MEGIESGMLSPFAAAAAPATAITTTAATAATTTAAATTTTAAAAAATAPVPTAAATSAARGGNTPLFVYNEHKAAIKAVCFQPQADGLLASGGGTADRHIRFWNTQL